MTGFKEFWNAAKSDPSSQLLIATEAQVRDEVTCPRCASCLDFFLHNLNFLDRKYKGDLDVIRVYRKGAHYSIKEGEMFAIIHRPPPSSSATIPNGATPPLLSSSPLADADHHALPTFQICPPILFNAEDLARLERDGTLGPYWESGPAGLSLTDGKPATAPSSASKKSKKKKEAVAQPPVASENCSYCSSMLQVRFVNMVTYPRPPDIFSLLLNKTENVGTVRAIMHRIVSERVKQMSDLVITSRGRVLEDGATIGGLLKDNQMLVISENPASKQLPAGPQSTTTKDNSLTVSMMSELGELLFGANQQPKKQMLPTKKRPVLVDELNWARGVEIAMRAAARVARGKIEQAWVKERVAQQNEQQLMEELLAEESKKELAERKKLKQKEKRDQLKREQLLLAEQEEAEAKARERELEEQKREEEERARREKEEHEAEERRAREEKERKEQAEKDRLAAVPPPLLAPSPPPAAVANLAGSATKEGKKKKKKELQSSAAAAVPGFAKPEPVPASKPSEPLPLKQAPPDPPPSPAKPLVELPPPPPRPRNNNPPPASSSSKPKQPVLGPVQPLLPPPKLSQPVSQKLPSLNFAGETDDELLLRSASPAPPPLRAPPGIQGRPAPPSLLTSVPAPLPAVTAFLPPSLSLAGPGLAQPILFPPNKHKCMACGTGLAEGARFCSSCGTAVVATQPEVPVSSGRLSFFASLRG